MGAKMKKAVRRTTAAVAVALLVTLSVPSMAMAASFHDPAIPKSCKGVVHTQTTTIKQLFSTHTLSTKYTNWKGFYSAGRGGYSFTYQSTSTNTTWLGSTSLTGPKLSGRCYA